MLQNNFTNDLAISANGTFKFATSIATGATYNVTVRSQPSGSPPQACMVSAGSGTIGTAPVTNVAVTCQAVAATALYGTYAYVTSQNTGSVSVVNTTTSAMTRSVQVGASPAGVAVTPDGAVAYVTNSAANSVTVIDTFTNSVITTIGVGSNPQGVTVSPAGTFAYVANKDSNTVSVINTSTNAVTATISLGSGTGPVDVAVGTSGARLYVANSTNNRVAVINTSNNTVLTTIVVGTTPRGLAISPNGANVYVACMGSEVTVIDTASNAVSAHIAMGAGEAPSAVAITPSGIAAYVTKYYTNDVAVINTPSRSVAATVKGLGSLPTSVAITADGTAAYVANQNSHTLSAISTTSNTVTATIGVGESPSAVAIAAVAPFNFGGFVSPVGAPPTVYTFNAGSTLSVKFSLNGVQRLSIFASGYPKSQTIACDTLLPAGAVESPATPGSSDLSYDAGADVYSYAWRTDKSWSNTCRQLIVRFSDLIDHVAYFKLK